MPSITNVHKKHSSTFTLLAYVVIGLAVVSAAWALGYAPGEAHAREQAGSQEPNVPAWEHQAPRPTGATLNDIDMISANEGWAVGQYIGNGGVVIHTTDAGVTWEYSTTGVEEPNYAVRFLSPTHGWISSNNTVFRTTDGGRTWAEPQNKVLAGSLYFLEFATLNDGFTTSGIDRGYFRTTDGGVTWQFRSMPRNVAGIQFFDANNGIASTETGVFHTTDRGATWTFTPGHGASFFLNHNLGWAVYENVSQRTTDGGATWQSGSMPAGAWVYDMHFVDAQNGWATGSGLQILRTTDGGMTWSFSRQPDTYPHLIYDGWAIDFGDPAHGVTVGGIAGWSVRTMGVILSTSDGGASWVPRLNGSGTITNRIFALDASRAWAANDYGETLWTTDGGERWHLASVQPGGDMRDIGFADANTGWVTGGGGLVFRSTDGGRTWVQQFPNTRGLPMLGLHVINSQTVIVVGGGGTGSSAVAERTTDGGATWHSVNAQAGWQLTDVYFASPTTGWITGWGSDGYARISRSTDGGLTWTPQNVPAGPPLHQISFADESNGWAVGGGGEGGRVLHTTNGGATWVQQNSGIPGPETLTAVDAVSPSVAWLASSSTMGRAQVRRTTDGGATWVEEPTGTHTYNWWNTIFFLTPDYGWVGGSTGEPRGGILRRVPEASTPTPTGTPGSPTSTSIPTFTAVSTNTPNASPTCTPVSQTFNGSIMAGDPIASQGLEPDMIESTCQVPKTCPQIFTEAFIRYDSYTFTNTGSSTRCITVQLDGTTCGFDIEGVMSRAYLGSFNPHNACQNYLADGGFWSDPYAGALSYSFNVPTGATFVVVVEETGDGAGCYGYTLTVSGVESCAQPTSTPTPNVTATRTPTTVGGAVLVGHVDWEGRPAQPHPLQALPIALTLKLGASETSYSGMTDASGYFTVPVGNLPSGTYTWRVKGPHGLEGPSTSPGFLANSGSVALAGAPSTSQEMGTMQAGDANNDNLIDVSDFTILKRAFGTTQGQPGFDARADFNGDNTIDVSDFNFIKLNFGHLGAPPLAPAGPTR